jgi:hypothetical protein
MASDIPEGAVLLETSMGPIVIELYRAHAPKTCENFYQLAQRGYYNGVIFHRIVKVCVSQIASSAAALPGLPAGPRPWLSHDFFVLRDQAVLHEVTIKSHAVASISAFEIVLTSVVRKFRIL